MLGLEDSLNHALAIIGGGRFYLEACQHCFLT